MTLLVAVGRENQLVDLHFSILYLVAFHLHLLTHMSLDLFWVADFCGFALLVNKDDIAAFVGAIRVTRCSRLLVIDAFGIAYPARPFNGLVLVLRVYQHHETQDHG